jgi:hypothetical protein
MNMKMKITRIKDLISRLESGQTVSTRALSRVLTEKQMATLEEEWKEEKSSRKVQKPLAIKKYEALIKAAILLYGRADRMYFKGVQHHKIKSMSQKADNAFELALEHLEEAIGSDGSLRLWIDRDLKDASCDPIGIPRVIGSASFECQSKQKVPFLSLTKRQLKFYALEQALEALEPKPIESQDKSVTFLCPPRKMHNFEGFVY